MPSTITGSDNFTTAGGNDGKAKAWVNFNGVGVAAVRSQYNVSGITDNGTGDYSPVFSTLMIDSNYVVGIIIQNTSNSTLYGANSGCIKIGTSFTTSTFNMQAYRQTRLADNAALADSDMILVTVHGN